MKKLIALCFICAAVTISCGKKIMPESDANNQSRQASEKEEKTAKQSGTTSSSSDNNTTPAFRNMKGAQAVVPDAAIPGSLDAGKTVYVSKCGSCHALKNPSEYTVSQTYAYLKTESPKAKLDKLEGEQVTAYLIANAKR